jgi:hypothetical protein
MARSGEIHTAKDRRKADLLLAIKIMIDEQLKPNKIEDVILRMEEYLEALRKMQNDEAMAFINSLDAYIKDYFTREHNELDLKKMAVELTDIIYIKISAFDVRDIHTAGYIGKVVASHFWELKMKGILCFYILDNSIRDDRFKMTVELFGSSGFAKIYPYSVKELEHSDQYTKLPTLDYKTVEKEIDEAKANKRHIFYVEKDDSVNYLKDVLHIAEEFQSEYVCIFRNKAPSEHKTANWLMGSFGDILK